MRDENGNLLDVFGRPINKITEWLSIFTTWDHSVPANARNY